MRRLWARLNLRVQAAVAVLVPCVAVALFASVFFPSRLNEQANSALENQAQSVGKLAVANAAPTMRLIRDGLSNPEELDPVLKGVREGGNIEHLGVITVVKEAVTGDGASRHFTLPPGSKLQVRGDVPPGTYRLPDPGQCELERGAQLTVLCTGQDQDYEVLLVSTVSLAGLRSAERANRSAGLYVLLITVVVGLVLAFLFSGALAGPISVVTRVAREVASGDVTVSRVDVSGSGEVRSMAQSVNEMLASLRVLVTQMVSLTGRLSGAAQGLIAASADQEHVTSQQSAYGQQIAATFEELSRTAEMITASTDVVE